MGEVPMLRMLTEVDHSINKIEPGAVACCLRMVLARAVDLKDVVVSHVEIRVAGGAGEFSELLLGANVTWTCGLDFTQMRQFPAAFF